MFLDDRVCHGQPQPRSVTHLFRREERIEDLALDLGGNSGPAVGDFQRDGVALDIEPCSNDEMARVTHRQHRLFGVRQEVEEHLRELVCIGEDWGQTGRQGGIDRDARELLLVGAPRQRLIHDLVEVDHRSRRPTLAREGQQVADDPRGAVGLAEDDIDPQTHSVIEGFG